MSDFTGDGGDNSITGTAAVDSIDFSQGGEDTVSAGDGNDSLDAGGALDAGDHIDGGAGGVDFLYLDGDYSLVFNDTTVTGVEFIHLSSGHDYDFTLADANAALGTNIPLAIFANDLFVGDHLRLDATALQAGHGVRVITYFGDVRVFGGAGADSVTAYDAGRITFDGQGGDDRVDVLRPLTRHDRLTGGDGGQDQLVLEGGGDDAFTGKMLMGFESVTLFGGDYILTMSDANVGFGHVLLVNADGLGLGEHLNFDGSAERSGAYQVVGGDDADTLTGGRGGDTLAGKDGDDMITGGRGGDTMSGSFGGDTFVYLSLADSGHHKQFDLITDLDADDHIDLSAIDANVGKAGNQAFHVVSALTGHAGELAFFYDAAHDQTVAEGDVDGDGKADITIHMQGSVAGFTGWVL